MEVRLEYQVGYEWFCGQILNVESLEEILAFYKANHLGPGPSKERAILELEYVPPTEGGWKFK